MRPTLPLATLCLATSLYGMASAANLPVIAKDLNEQVQMLPTGSGFGSIELETTLFIPPGQGPFPLVVINHGKAFGNPRFDPRARYLVASREFLKRGYLVALPMRRGFSKSGGTYVATGCNIESNGEMQAEDLLGALGNLTRRPDVDASRILLVGQSHGGLTVMAAGAKGFPGVRGMLNFAGGLKLTDNFCTWERSLVDAFGAYGRTTRTPSLWFYGDNDSYWGKELPKAMFQAYTGAGGPAEMVAYGTFAGGDAHGMFSSARGLSIWWPRVESFLAKVGLPTEVRYQISASPRPPRTGFAELDQIEAVPYLDAKRRDLYRRFLAMPLPRAFAIAPTGNVGWAFEGSDPQASALANCEKFAKTPCRLYAVDEDVVWAPPE